MQISFDIGGTFTDFALLEPDGRLTVWKLPTTPRAPADAVVEGISRLFRGGEHDQAAVEGLLHATTIATNAILERKGARTALVTTKGFRDVLLIGRQKRYDTNDLHLDKPQPLVRRRDVFEVSERLASDGSVLQAIEPAEAEAVARDVAAGRYEAVAIVFLHAYANPAHEQRMAEIIAAAMPHMRIAVSSVVSPKFREYERTSTTVASAYVSPLVAGYLDALDGAMKSLGLQAPLSIMQSNGGLASPGLAKAFPIRIVESGPAAGVLFCAEVGREEGFDQVITFDMGGTTAKLGAIDEGRPAVTPNFEVDAVNYRKGSGLPLNVMAVELLEIGAGGGSIARTKMGLITIGPDSAGADPGPVCYSRGGAEPTITDANLVLGYLDPAYFNGGAMALDSAKAAAAIEQQIAAPLGMTTHQAAWGIHTVANANMERAMRIVSMERGRDPRRYALVAFGGAGPLHASRLARALEIPLVIVPRGAGVGSALGLLVAERKFDVALTRIVRLDGHAQESISAIFEALEERVVQETRHMHSEGIPRLERSASMHHVGQGYEIRVTLPDGTVGPGYEAAMLRAFHDAYRREYGYNDPESAVEVIDWYLVATFPGSRAGQRLHLKPASGKRDAVRDERPIYLPESNGLMPCKVLDRYAMPGGRQFEGPVLIEEPECTTLVLPGDTVRVSEAGNLVISIRGAA